MYLDIWVKVGYILSCSSIILFLLLQFTSIDTDYFNLKEYMSSRYGYEYSIFGVSQVKDFGLITVFRVSNYFYEPQYAGLYFVINILISRMQYVRDRYPKWGWFNLFGGLLTFSASFYFVMMLFYFINFLSKIKLHGRLFLLAIAIVSFVVAIQVAPPLDTLFQFTSYSDRMIRVGNAINILSNISSITNLLFGYGIEYTGGSDGGLTIGFFQVLVEHGLAGLLLILFLMFLFFKNSTSSYFVFLLYFFVFPWNVNHIYWMGALALLKVRPIVFNTDQSRVVSTPVKNSHSL